MPLREVNKRLVRCVDCPKLVDVFFPAEIQGVWSDAKWRCTATGQVFPEYWLVEMERECLHCKKSCLH